MTDTYRAFLLEHRDHPEWGRESIRYVGTPTTVEQIEADMPAYRVVGARESIGESKPWMRVVPVTRKKKVAAAKPEAA